MRYDEIDRIKVVDEGFKLAKKEYFRKREAALAELIKDRNLTDVVVNTITGDRGFISVIEGYDDEKPYIAFKKLRKNGTIFKHYKRIGDIDCYKAQADMTVEDWKNTER